MKNKFNLVVRLIIAGILLQTLFFKFTAAPESVFIFNTLQVEPWGRWLSGVAELVASLLLFVPSVYVLGALAAQVIMLGAILSHILFLGLEVQNDHGLLFSLACIVFTLSSIIVFQNLNELFAWSKKIKDLYARNPNQ